MIRKLQFQFITVAMVAMFLVLGVIMTAINTINYRNIVEEADGILQVLAQYGGDLPPRADKQKNGTADPEESKPREQDDWDGKKEQSEEEHLMEHVRESRYFWVLLDGRGNAVQTDIRHISAVDAETAAQMAETVLRGGKTMGFSAEYRYLVTGSGENTRVIFLRSSRSLENFWNFLQISLSISAVGLVAVFALILVFSRQIVRPVSESYEKQKRFITDAGHELKTPITIIDADAEVLEMEQGSNEWLRDIRNQSRRLRDLTEQLIFLSRMEEERAEKAMIEFPLSDMVGETVQSFAALAKTGGKEFVQEIEPMISFLGDQTAIRRTVSALVDNSVKYSVPGTQIRVRLCRQGRNLCLTVSNDTDQLAKEDIPNLFDRFYRGDKSRNGETGGFGIGLSVAQAVVSAHKGKISAQLGENGRLTVTVLLPQNT